MERLIHVIEDEEDIAKLIAYNLTLEGFRVSHFASGEEGLKAVSSESPDLFRGLC